MNESCDLDMWDRMCVSDQIAHYACAEVNFKEKRSLTFSKCLGGFMSCVERMRRVLKRLKMF